MQRHGSYFGKRGEARHGRSKKFSHSQWFLEMIGRKGARIGRGEIQYLILDSLNEKKRHGYDIMQFIEEKMSGMYRPSPGALYPSLEMLEDLEMISSNVEGKRKVYELTEKGREEIEAKGFIIQDIYDDVGQSLHAGLEAFFEKIHEELIIMFRSISRSFRKGKLEEDKADKILEIIRGAAARVTEILNG